MHEQFVSQLKLDIQQLCEAKYGSVAVVFEQLVPEGDNLAAVRFAVSDQHGFITRHYGKAGYQNDHLVLDTFTI